MYTVNIELLNKLERKIRRYDFKSKMELFRKLDHIFNFNNNDYDNNLTSSVFEDASLKWFKNAEIFPWEIEYISLIAAISGEWDGPIEKLNNLSDFNSLLKWYRKYNPPVSHLRDKKTSDNLEDINSRKDLDLFFLRTALQQIDLQNNPLVSLYRYNYFFKFKSKNMDAKKIFNQTLDYPYDKYVDLVLMIYLLSYISPNNLTQEKVINEIGKDKLFSTYELKDILDHLTIERPNLKEIYNRFKSDDERMKIYNFNPLRMKPIIKENKKLLLPMPQLLFKAITEGFYHWLCSQSDYTKFRNDFGKYIFESYINKVLNWNDPDYKIIPEFEYNIGHNKLLSPDFILVKENNLIFIEAKSTTPTNKLKSTDLNEYLSQLEKAYSIGVLQCLKKENHLRNGHLIHEKIPQNVNNIYYLIITLENFHIPPSEFMQNNIIDLCNKEGEDLSKNKHFHVMGIEILEELIEQDNKGLFQFLKYREENNHTFRTFPSTDINRIVKQKETRMHKFWNKRLEEIRKTIFN